ncbi:MAG: WXG100 family type VII secretion target [Acidimicrobiia bacterium]|nr:WXG100 family type VII secretion target [Acidimicrobiia bacterium]
MTTKKEKQMPQIGGGIEDMGVLVSTFTTKATEVNDLKQAIDSQLLGTWWIGPASDRFRAEWDGQFKPNLVALQNALNEAANEVRRRMEALQSAGS